ncbi:hypothetical protein QL285_042717 [Trifolium repens]|nr:hypothetical protein QL285_042717 [Trifolium repens]
MDELQALKYDESVAAAARYSHKIKASSLPFATPYNVISILPQAPKQRRNTPCSNPVHCAAYTENPCCSAVTVLSLTEQD